MKMKEICADERPREKMVQKGAKALTNAELLAILIGSGTQRENVLEVANRLLVKSEGKLSSLSEMSQEEMRELSGIGPSRYAAIAAAFELGKRRHLEDPSASRTPVTTSKAVWKIMIPHMAGLTHEEFWVLFLNRKNHLIHKEMISLGGLSATVVDPRIVVKTALDKHASAIILVHNHPSGDPAPGQCDIEETENLKTAVNTFDIAMMDHVIVCDSCWYSFADGMTTMAGKH